MTTLWIVVAVMAVALAAEIFALVGLMLTARRAARMVADVTEEINGKLRPSIAAVQELKTFVQPHFEVVQRDGKEIGATLAARAQSVKVSAQDAERRLQKIRLRFQTNGVQTIEQLQSGRQVIEESVVGPILTIGRVVRAISSTIWLLRKVA
jgi:hypothetical protein